MTNGYFFDKNTWSINLDGPGTPIHPLLALLITPIMGLAFLMFLPFIGFYLAFIALGKKIYSLTGLFEHLTSPAPTAGEAHLTGHEPGDKTDSPALEEISKEISSRRK